MILNSIIKVNFKEYIFTIQKDGRNRKILAKYLTDNQTKTVKKVYQYFKKLRSGNDRLFLNKSDSYRKAFQNARNIISKDYIQSGIHSLRKEFANDYYMREIEKGRTEKDVKLELTKLLGHNRLDVLKWYI